MSLADQTLTTTGFSVGICVTGNADATPGLVKEMLSERPPPGLYLRKVIVIASQCSVGAVSRLQGIQEKESRVVIVSEDVRRGKADAINKILTLAEGDLVVLVNSDARPKADALPALLSALASDSGVGAVSAMPVTSPRPGLASTLADLMWTTHNECSLALNHMNLANHASDELIAFRLKAIAQLPDGLVNDGAFIAATVRRQGYSVKFSTAARVGIETPRRVSDLIGQRRRILFGHAQVWRKLGNPPKTVESLLFLSPSIGLRLLVTSVSRRTRFLLALPVAILVEFTASALAVWDGIRSTKRHVVWRRFT